MKKRDMIVFVIIGALIGAGFASGQEIYLFFYKYGKNGILGLITCCALISYIIYKTLKIIYEKEEINSYKDFLNYIFNCKKISEIYNLIINLFLLTTFYIMISGFGAYFKQEYNINEIIGASILAIICYFVFLTNIKGLTKINSIIVPILIICILIIGTVNIREISIRDIGKNIEIIDKGWFFKSTLYASYNLILVIPVIVNFKKYLKNKKQIIKISLIIGLILFILSINIFLLILNIKNNNLNKIEMPAVYSIKENFPYFKTIYGIIILLSIFTTAISLGISFLENIVKNKNNYPRIAGIMCITSVIISNLGFSNLVKILFPIFGYLGLIEIYFISKKKTDN